MHEPMLTISVAKTIGGCTWMKFYILYFPSSINLIKSDSHEIQFILFRINLHAKILKRLANFMIFIIYSRMHNNNMMLYGDQLIASVSKTETSVIAVSVLKSTIFCYYLTD